VRRHLHKDGGFSLVEIMVALFIMALASAMLVMVMPARPDAVNSEAEQFEMVLSRTLDQAISRGQAQGIRFEENTYAVYARINGRWLPVRGAARHMSQGVTASVLSEGRNEADDVRPQIVMDASGVVSGPDVRFAKGALTRDVQLYGRPDQ
jgi:prepilin-type N-terminal cleavage/methylation domain-containing protein